MYAIRSYYALIDARIEAAEVRDGESHDTLARFLRVLSFEQIASEEQVGQDDSGGEDIRAAIGDLVV